MKQSSVNLWYNSVKKLLFKYRDGFYEMPVMSNSPIATVKSISKMPFVKHKPQKKYFESNNPFINAHVLYHQIEDGLWYMQSSATFKENINFVCKTNKTSPSDYFKLYLEITESKVKNKNAYLNGVSYINYSWILLKSEEGNAHTCFKGNETFSMIIFMHKNWIKENLYHDEVILQTSLKDFFKSRYEFIIVKEDQTTAEDFKVKSEQIFKLSLTTNNENVHQAWKEFISCFIYRFANKYQEQDLGVKLLEISTVNRIKIFNVEKYLVDNIYSSFMGIDVLAKKVGLSPTKMKSDFKLIYGETIFQYFRKKQLKMARQIIKKNPKKELKEISSQFGYSNHGKFSIAYRDYFGVLPSDEI